MPPTKGEKTMSSRLLTMKFMQRASATTPSADSSSAAASTPASRSPSDPRPSKRRRLSPSSPAGSQPASSSPATPRATPAHNADREAVRAAVAAEERRRSVAVARQVRESGETRWVLSVRDEDDERPAQTTGGDLGGLRVRQTGFAEIDGEVDRQKEEGEEQGVSGKVGRRAFGKFSAAATAAVRNGGDDSDSLSSSDEDGDEGDTAGQNGAAAMIRDERKRARKVAQAGSANTPQPQQRAEVNLKKLRSISGGGGQASAGPKFQAQTECYKCGKKGHMKKDCPGRKRR